MRYTDKIREIKDFPKKGIGFKDITPLLQDGKAFKKSIKELARLVESKNFDIIVAPEARGFIIGTALAYELEKAFSPARKSGKLPYDTIKAQYELEYGNDVLEIHKDAVKKGQKVLIVDDLLATGGTINSTVELVEKLGGDIIGFAFLIELTFLNGRDKLSDYDVFSLIKY